MRARPSSPTRKADGIALRRGLRLAARLALLAYSVRSTKQGDKTAHQDSGWLMGQCEINRFRIAPLFISAF